MGLVGSVEDVEGNYLPVRAMALSRVLSHIRDGGDFNVKTVDASPSPTPPPELRFFYRGTYIKYVG